MGRELKRVPLDFDWPLEIIWPGYYGESVCGIVSDYIAKHLDTEKHCELCKKFGKLSGLSDGRGCTEFPKYEPPEGEGYQLWGTTTEGAPVSPIFKTLDELCKWCEENATTFADFKASKEEWKKMLSDDFVHHTEGRITFI